MQAIGPMTKFIAVFLMWFSIALSYPARADDISEAEPSVVRVVVVSFDEFGDPVGLGHGTGFAITSNRVVTNAHVITAGYREVSLYVVAGNSKAASKARVIYKDPSKDLALLQIDGSLPPLTIFNGKVPDGANVFALGYPGNVDVATATSLRDYIGPKDAVRSQGHFANRRTISGIDAILHTAAIARGNSGGPLLDECARVIGVNSFTTNSGSGDSPFGFAISNKELRSFLKSAGQQVKEVNSRCLIAAERLAAEQADAVKERVRVEMTARAQERSDRAAREKVAALLQRTTENWIAVAIIFGLFGFISLGAGGLLFAKDRTAPASRLSATGIVLAIVGIVIFFARPTGGEVDVAGMQPEQNLTANLASPEIEPETAAQVANDAAEVSLGSTTTTPEASTYNLDENLFAEGPGDVPVRPTGRDVEEVDYNEGL
jgi:V8-like Glu-specific endopeptidase